MNTVSTQPEATWVTRRCNWRESTSTTMSHPVSSAAPPGLRPSPSDPAVPLPNPRPSPPGPWPSPPQILATPLWGPSHPVPDPRPPPPGPRPSLSRTRPYPSGTPAFPGLLRPIQGWRSGCRPCARVVCPRKFSRDIAGCPTPSSLPLGREIRRQFLSNSRIWPITGSELLN